MRIARRPIAAAALVLAVLVAGPLGNDRVRAQTPGRPPGSDIVLPNASTDRHVKRCLFLALRRQNPKLDAMTTTVENAGAILDIPIVLDAVATCRLAAAKFPADKDVIIATYTATEVLNVLLFGITDHPGTAAEALAKVRRMDVRPDDPLFGRLVMFALGSAYHHGIGVTANISEAIEWYRKAGAGGDRVSMRELARIFMTGSGVAVNVELAARLLLAAIIAGDEHERDELVASQGAALTKEMRTAIQNELKRLGNDSVAPTGTFDKETLAALSKLTVKKEAAPQD
ncbi:MAG TPA: hypothetical protein PK264_12660, partial [Hyphomicrobiaceae bacterium]|nr:hypothetical protein [Hyphomicrobiaceae bacterium]